ncbi:MULTISPECIES: hypothetical protein [Kitasatospora]|uniref:hypothetical protein n=1 Tax=Kitasatospora TaxID=2063 RepID=UPI0002DCF237|nr:MULTISPECIES: hypothetical protein [Kitasatospora]
MNDPSYYPLVSPVPPRLPRPQAGPAAPPAPTAPEALEALEAPERGWPARDFTGAACSDASWGGWLDERSGGRLS